MELSENQISYKIIGVALEIHRTYGVGLLEKAYEDILAYELKELGLDVKAQLSLPLKHKDLVIENAYRLDLLVNEKVIIEVKAVSELHPIVDAQVLTYLKLTKLKLGIIINFHSKLLKDGIKRKVNKL
ncbi:GxxExxY protein [Frigoriflavimonas asaccharolytica]|uniref:GxxExxY protein n=1 Tax=Frigoriflavimonas asaccharolytica TaxID=2735899 RepID=A0A8J8GA79_9FLAO|nr:GxxExxY protein [Frigoriflavimonas asaccharolytica]NRS93500.1 GxxExxY protein [Frigoriflavimonas asaccharolytica]